MKKRLVLIGLILLSVLLAIGVSTYPKKQEKTEEKEKVDAVAHVVTAKEKKAIMKDAADAIERLQAVRGDANDLSLFLDDPLLKETAAQIEADSQAGKIKIRRLKNTKLELKNITMGIAGVQLLYTDESYYVDKETGEKLSEPTGTREKLSLVLREVDGTWKIYTTLGEVRPDWQSKETTSN